MRNRYEIRGNIVVITLTRRGGKEPFEAVVSRRRLPKLLQLDVRWYAKPDKWMKYIVVAEVRDGKRKKTIQLDRYITDCEDNRFIVHDDCDPFNLTDENLIVRSSNRTGVFRSGAQKPVGVHHEHETGKWLVVAIVNWKRRPIGYYKSKEEAEKALEQLQMYWKKYT